MPRRDREYDDEPQPPPAKGGFPLWLILVLGGMVVGLFVCGGVGTLAYLMYKRDVAQREMMVEQDMMMAEREQAEAEVRRDEMLWLKVEQRHGLRDRVLLSRDEFRTKVAGKTESEVTASVGKPVSTEEANGEIRWVYEQGTRDLENPMERHNRVVVTFRNGRVAEVTFE